MEVFVFDLEANGFVNEATKTHCGVFKKLGTKEVHKFRPHQIEEMLEFMSKIDVLIGHNILGYDFPLLKKLYGFEYKGKKVDTLIMSRLLNPKRMSPPDCPNKKAPHSVEAWGYRVGRGKPEHDDWENFSEAMLHRCSEDVEIQELIYKELLKEAKGGNWRNAFLLTFRLFENLQLQEDYGWKVDRPYMEESIGVLNRWIDRIDRAISPRLPTILEINEDKIKGVFKYVTKPFLKSGRYSKSVCEWLRSCGYGDDSDIVLGPFSRVSFRKVDLDSRVEIIDYLLSLGWEPLEYNYNKLTGEQTSPKLSKDDPFDGITDKLGKLVAKRVQCKHRRSSIEGLIKLIREDGAIPSVINNLAVTGRATHRNIVNIPSADSFFGKRMRKMFVSRPGMVLVSTDSAGNQLRQLAARMGDPDYINTVVNGRQEDGTDIHTINQRAANLPSRAKAKTFIYGFLFGAGDGKIGKIVDGTAAHGRELKSEFLKGLPALGRLLDNLKEQWRKTAKKRFNPKFNTMEYYDGYITGLDGRPIKVASEHQLLVYLLQSDEAIQMTAAYNMMVARLSKKYVYGVDFGVVCFYHDEYTVECKPEIAEDVRKISEECIVKAGEFFKIPCPHAGEGKIGHNWYEVH